MPISFFQTYANKISNKLRGVVHVPAVGKKRGDTLISYLTEPFTKFPNKPLSNLHTNYWECREIARLFSMRGYDVDIIEWDNEKFVPKKEYAACIDTHHNLERLSTLLPAHTLKVMHVVTSEAGFQNDAEKKRLTELEKRRGVRLSPRRQIPVTDNPSYADHLEGFGNRTVHATYARFRRPIFPIPISAVQLFDFPLKKDFAQARTHFLWFGGGGAVLKGLDLVLEAFARNPSLNLHVCGPVAAEHDFAEAYREELYETENIHTYGRIGVDTPLFSRLANMCGALVYPAFSEGTSGAVVQTMHAGLVPVITPETGIYEDAHTIVVKNPTVDSIEETIRMFSVLPPEKIQHMARDAWEYAQTHYTRDAFSKAYGHFIDSVLHL